MEKKVAEYTTNNIKVTIHVPENVSESVRTNRINRLYDILTSQPSEEDGEKADDIDKKFA